MRALPSSFSVLFQPCCCCLFPRLLYHGSSGAVWSGGGTCEQLFALPGLIFCVEFQFSSIRHDVKHSLKFRKHASSVQQAIHGSASIQHSLYPKHLHGLIAVTLIQRFGGALNLNPNAARSSFTCNFSMASTAQKSRSLILQTVLPVSRCTPVANSKCGQAQACQSRSQGYKCHNTSVYCASKRHAWGKGSM